MSVVSLLFEPGSRPDKAAVTALAQGAGGFSISHDPRTGGSEDGDWLELLASGLTFDLRGLAPGAPAASPPLAHAYGIDDQRDRLDLQAIQLQPGPHLAGGRTMLPVIRSLAWLAACLASLDGARAIAWHPARCWSSPGAFRTSIQEWIDGGPFPAFCLAALVRDSAGAMQSEGLALIVGQELRLEPDTAVDPASAARLAVRAMHWLVEHGPVASLQCLTGPDGEELTIEPSANRRFARVRRR